LTAPTTEFEQKFTEVLRSRAATAPCRVIREPHPHPSRRLAQDGRFPPCRHRRDLSLDTERLRRRPSGLRQPRELHYSAQPRRGTTASRHTRNGPGQPLVDTIRRGEDHLSAIVRGSYRSVCPRCSHGSTGVDPEFLELFSAENTARLAPLFAGSAMLRTGATARSTSKPIPVPALCRPPTSHWRAGARVDVGRPHQRLDQPLRGNSPTPGLALLRMWCGAGLWPHLPPLSAPEQGNHS
jgi:hypothetical protein